MEGRAEELVQRVLIAAGDLSREAVESLIEQARAEAQSEVKSLLKSAIKANLLEAALKRLQNEQPDAPPRTAGEEQTACYLYCLMSSDRDVPAAMDRVDGSPVQTISSGALKAVASRVSVDEFGQSSLDRNIQDPRWVERKVRAHDAVVKAAFAEGPIIPLRFCTVLRDEEAVRRVLEAHAELVHRTLNNIAQTKEWGLKVLWRESEHDQQPASGREYLLRTRAAINGERCDEAQRQAMAMHERLLSFTRDAALLTIRPLADDGQVLLNAAYLVADQDEAQFHESARALCDEGQEQGMACEVTGPWPPYNFVKLDLSLEPAKQN